MRASHAGSGRDYAEAFALAVVDVLTDVRPGLDGEKVVGSIASGQLLARTRAYLVGDLDLQHQIGLERQLDTGLEMWIRSAPHGPPAALGRVDVEVAADVTSLGDLRWWTRFRADVVREGGVWKLAAFSEVGQSGPRRAANLTTSQRRSFLPGTGWRRIPPASP